MADQGNVDLAVEGGDDVGEFSSATAGAQVDGAFQRLFEEGSFGLGEADHRAGWALLRGILDARAGGLEVGVVEELGVGQGDLDLGDIGFAGIGGEDGGRAGLPACLVEPEKPMVSLGAKGRMRQLATWKWADGVATGAFGAEYFGFDGEGIAVGRVEGEVQGG